MYSTSERYKKAISRDIQWWESKLVIDGTEYFDFMKLDGKLGICAEEHVSFGGTVTAYLDVQIPEMTSSVQFIGRQAIYYVGLHLEDYNIGEEPDIEWIKMGVYNIVDPQLNDDVVTFTAYDNMYKTQQGFFSALSGNQPVAAVLREQCSKIGITYAGSDSGESISIDKLQGLQMRDAISYIASFCGKNAVMNRDGNLELRWFSAVEFTASPDICSSTFSVGQADTIVRRITCAVDAETNLNAGNDTGSIITLSNPCMTQAQLNAIYNKVNGFSYRSCSVNIIMGHPELDVGDIISVQDLDGSIYKVPIMIMDIIDDSGIQQTITSSAKTEQQEQYSFQGNISQQVQTNYSEYIATKRLLADTIIAYDGKFGTITTDFLTVNQKITAHEGEFSTFKADTAAFKIATAEEFTAIHAAIDDLDVNTINAALAKINVMEGNLATIDTIINGHFTSDSVHSLIINAENTVFSNSVIKSAMIDSVAADKVTAGTIDASSIHFKSQSGRLDIFGETLQIKDNTRPRVQIGKDASGDYNMYVWDAAGKLMFDATGVTANGIQRPIIVDSMVADNANISGDKINITSLVKEINDGTEVINSSHILVDGANQSLSVVYNTITGDISTLSTALSVEQGKISSLITDVSQAKGDVSTLKTNYSSLTQTVNGINSTVSSHSTSINNLNNMEIGGRNLALKTAVSKTMVGANIKNQTADFYNLTGNADDYKGKKITVSYDYEITGAIKTGTISLRFNSNPWSSIDLPIYLGTDAEKGHRKFTSVVPNGITGLNIGVRADGMQGTILFKNVKIVIGDKATGGWTPAPEDIDASIKTVSDKTSVLEQTVNGFDARITSATSTSGNALTKANEISATVNGLTVRVSTAETNASTALSKTNTLEQKVTATSLITTIASGISGGTALSTTKFVMDASGLHIKSGGFDISNNAGTKVFSADTAGNLSITAAINAASGKIGKFTLNDGLTYTGSSTYQGMGGSVTETYSFIISPDSVHKNLGDIARDFVSGWKNPLLKVNTSNENSFELYPDGWLRARQIKMGDGLVEGTLYFGSSQYSNSASINSGGNIWAAGGVQAKNFVAANGQGLRVLNSSGVPTTLIYTDSSDNARIPNNDFIVSKAMTVYGSLYARASSWIGSNYSAGGWIGFYDKYGGTRKGYIGYGTVTETQFNIYNNEGAHNGVALDATANGNWTHGRFIPLYGGMALGSSSNRWYRLYSSVGCDTSSDIRLKNSIRGYDERYEAMYMDMQPVTFELNAVPGQRQGGLIAQWTKDAMTKHGITDSEFGAYNYHPEDDTYGIIYEQLTSLNMHMVQKTIKRVDTAQQDIEYLKNRNVELERRVDTLRNEVIRLNNELFDTKSALSALRS
ncbi:hypothetical protein DWX17_13160 [[Clostridium] innocuum]|uniref:tail fiber domain-containing protein n=1 Tax=Clostridium innocuum TaxID=1522 RepID=UPI000E52E02F|nr:tail fiber domain-containing protein [[Clostridium] innocuum]RGT66941.1 hypothetical protein DWX17_13160 [[Clostridium] innocuum]